jgi:nucleoid-associated protein YgaU
MRFPGLSLGLAALALLFAPGCAYVHFGRIPALSASAIGGEEKLQEENSGLKLEKKILQQELALSRAQSDALRSAIENRTADGDTSRLLTEKLSETTRQLAALRADYAQLQAERTRGPAATPEEIAALQTRLATTEEQLAASLRNFTNLQADITRLHADVDAKTAENLTLVEQVKTLTTQNEQAQAALAQLNTELLAQKDSRVKAEQDAVTLRTQLASADARISELSRQRTSTAAEAKTLSVTPSNSAAAPGETGELGAQLDALRKKVWALEAERTDLQQRLTEADPGAKKPGASGSADPAASASPDPNLKGLKEENDALVAANADLAKTQNSLQTDLAQTQARVSALTTENAQLKSRLASAVSSGAVGPGNGSVTASFTTSTGGGSATTARYHTVAAGDTLSRISTQYYGTPARWADIYAANRDVLGDDNNLVIGRTLRIP